MRTSFIAGLLLVFFLGVGCTDRGAEARRALDESKAKIRADAARKEMETQPKAFKSPPFFQRHGSAPKSAPLSEKAETNP